MRLLRLIVLVISDLNIDLNPFRHKKLNVLTIISTLLINPQNLLSQPFLKKVRILLHRFFEIDPH